jgi:3-deoxy-manno-octulosonate cytidylyltransferase (CMP-KDO synthetase)
MKIIAVIPARLASSRFPRKILFPFHGLPMIEHVRRRALLSRSLAEVYVATCDEEIAEVIRGFGGNVIMTSDDHENGTTRIAEAVKNLDCTHVLLIQGDEPLVLPRHLESMISAMTANPRGEAWNATAAIKHFDEMDRHSFVKCVLRKPEQIMLCFRRSPFFSKQVEHQIVRKLLGLIAFSKDFLMKLTDLPPSPFEMLESIEQMRIIENGYSIESVTVAPSLPSVNEPAEVHIVLDYIESNEEQKLILAEILK